MKNSSHPFRTKVINSLRSSIHHDYKHEQTSTKMINQFTSQLLLIDDYAERKSLIKYWYKELRSADTLRRHHLQYQKPEDTKMLSYAINNLTLNFRKRFSKYFK